MSILSDPLPKVIESRDRREAPDMTNDGRPLTELASALLDAAAEILGPLHRP
ncbi:hypothetical protein [uncultured Roseovarius sp.]|uniref:hypothetical protein n=1 Tax=uncultured Roseovarius sp. TaxID=293344 RepID=UPI0025E010B4|nr:hypothetical protein [uncultured Roseovarius sp.]